MDHYAVLGLPPGTPIEEVRSQFRRLAMVFHPDRNSDDVWCQEQLKRLNASYEFLADAARKAEYDAALPHRSGEQTSRQPAAETRSDHAPRRPRTPLIPPTAAPNPGQRLVLAAIFCAAVIGAVVIGILIGSGESISSPFSEPVSVFAAPVAAVSPAPAAPSLGIGLGTDQTGSVKSEGAWPSSLMGDGGQAPGGPVQIDDPLQPSPVVPGQTGNGAPTAAAGYNTPLGP